MSSGGQTVLVVDDEPGILEIVQVHLQAQGFDVITAASGAEAIQHLLAARPHLIVLDPLLPDMDGWELLRRLKADPQTASIPVIILSALASNADIQHGLALGAMDYVTKPFDPQDLVARVRNYL